MSARSQILAESGVGLLPKQRSHVLFVLSGPGSTESGEFLRWYKMHFRQKLRATNGVVGISQYEQNNIDITNGKHTRLPLRYLSLVELSIDGAEAATPIIDLIAKLHREEESCREPATWLYFPTGEAVGLEPAYGRRTLTVAFANSVPGGEEEFREWYPTRHIRHALKVPVLVNGQCYSRTLFQKPGAMVAKFSMIAIYEQEGTPADLLNAFAAIPASEFDFPTLDLAPGRFVEWVYDPV
jgi:hypothetical protein